MRAVIVGYGRVGIRTARILKEEGHEVVIVDNDPEKTTRAENEGFTAHFGAGDDETVLDEALAPDADVLAALTGDVEVNHNACIYAGEHGLRTVLRIDADYPDEQYQRYAESADAIVYPELLGAAGAKTALLGGDISVLAELAENLQLTVLTVKAGADAVGQTLGRLELPAGARLYAHGRDDESLTIPLPSTSLEAGDRVALLVDLESLDETRTFFLGDAD